MHNNRLIDSENFCLFVYISRQKSVIHNNLLTPVSQIKIVVFSFVFSIENLLNYFILKKDLKKASAAVDVYFSCQINQVNTIVTHTINSGNR